MTPITAYKKEWIFGGFLCSTAPFIAVSYRLLFGLKILQNISHVFDIFFCNINISKYLKTEKKSPQKVSHLPPKNTFLMQFVVHPRNL
jgi:hypothetical protein